MIQMSAAANSATPRNSLTRRDAVDPPTSDLHDDGQHERPAARAFANEASQLHPKLLFDEALIGTLLHTRLLDDFGQNAGAVRQKRLAIVQHEAARDHFGNAFERAGLLVDCHDRHHEAVFGQMAAVAKHLVANFARASAVDEHAADRGLPTDARFIGVELQDVAVLGAQDLRLRLTAGEDALGDSGMLRELPELAMNRHEVPGADERQHQLQLLLAAMPRDVDVLDPLVNDVG